MRRERSAGPLRVGERLKDRYDILELIGDGGQGWVYRARHRILEQDVAIKVVEGNEEALIRGAREAKSLAIFRSQDSARSQNIVQIHDADIEDGFLFLVMEYLRGRPWKGALKEHGKLRVEEVLALGLQAADAIALAHEHNIVHRDLKPENIYLTRGNVAKVLDFGIAKLADDQYKTNDGLILGTLLYMAPELLQGMNVTPACDIFALGSLMYYSLAGIHPTYQVLAARKEQANRVNTVEVQCLQMPALLSDIEPNVPLYVAQLVQSAIAKQPKQRFASMQRFADAIRKCLTRYVEDPSVAGARLIARDLSMPGNVPLARAAPKIERTDRMAQTAPVQVGTPAAPAREKQFIALSGQTEPLARPDQAQPTPEPEAEGSESLHEPRQVTVTELPNSEVYGPMGTLRVKQEGPAGEPVQQLAFDPTERAATPPAATDRANQGTELTSSDQSPPIPSERANLRQTDRTQTTVARASTTGPSVTPKPVTPPPVSIQSNHAAGDSYYRVAVKRYVTWGVLAGGLLGGAALLTLGHRSNALSVHPSPTVQAVSQSASPISGTVALAPSAQGAPSAPESSVAPTPAEPVKPADARSVAATEPTPVAVPTASTAARRGAQAVPPSASARARQQEVARMRERMKELEADSNGSKGERPLWQ